MSKKGWILDDTLRVEPAYADWKGERLADLAGDLLRKRVDVILSNGNQATVAAARATRTIPIVFVNVTWPVELGLIDSFARPGRNSTGISYYSNSTSIDK